MLVSEPLLVERAEIIQEKEQRTERGSFADQIDKYSWVDVGSSFCSTRSTLPSAGLSSSMPMDHGDASNHLGSLSPRV